VQQLSDWGITHPPMAELLDTYNEAHKDAQLRPFRAGSSSVSLSRQFILGLFDDVIVGITDHLQQVLSSFQPKHLVLTGGFGNSTVLHVRACAARCMPAHVHLRAIESDPRWRARIA